MASIVSAGTTSGTSLNLSADTSGVLQLATNGTTTAVTIDTSQNISLGSGVTVNAYQGTSPSNGVYMGTVGGSSFFLATQTSTNTNLYLSKSSAVTDAGYMRFYNNTTETGVISLASNTLNISNVSGIQFPATQVASGNANTLDDYEEGDWTPTWVVASGSITANSSTSGKYVKIGRTVYIWGYISYQSNSSASGAVKVGGLPFSSGSGFGQFSNRSGGVYTIENSLFTSNSPNFGRIGNGSTEITPFISTATGSTNLSFSDFNTGASNYDQFVFAGQYLV